jgi:hypothetical protein
MGRVVDGEKKTRQKGSSMYRMASHRTMICRVPLPSVNPIHHNYEGDGDIVTL